MVLVGVLFSGACSKARDATRTDSTTVVAKPPAHDIESLHAFPIVGIAVRDTSSAWCAGFPPDSMARQPAAGDTVAIVFGAVESPPALYARIGARRSAQCHAEFPQPRWDGYSAYDLTLIQPVPDGDVSSVALAVVSASRWTRKDGRVVADLDGDVPEEAHRCAADEGEHFTIWNVVPGQAPIRRAHEYYDWGAQVERTCKPGDDGQ